MTVELVGVVAADGVRLAGVLETPAAGVDPAAPLEVVLGLHGTGTNYYAGAFFAGVREPLLRRGIALLRVNTRGHDLVVNLATDRGSRRGGAAYESFAECPLDVDAFLALLAARGYRRIGLWGHSSGAVKAIYSQAVAPNPLASCVIASSPPRLSHAAFRASSQGTQFFDDYLAARQHVEQGRGETLLEVKFPLPYLVSAAGFLEKYGPQEQLNIVRLLPRVKCPVLTTFASEELERHPAFLGLPQEITPPGTTAPHSTRGQPDVEIIAGANHQYTGQYEPLVDRVARWSQSQDGTAGLTKSCPA